MTRILTQAELDRMSDVLQNICNILTFMENNGKVYDILYIRYYALFQTLRNFVERGRTVDECELTALEYFLENDDIKGFLDEHVHVADNVVQLKRN